MSIQDMGSIGELIGAVAVIFSLIYLAMQIRQNTKAVRIQTYQAIMDASNRLGDSLAERNVDAIYRKGRKDPDSCSEEEMAQFMLIAGQVVNLYEGLYLHHQSGAIDDDFFENRWKTFHRMMHQPGFRRMWKRSRDYGGYYALSFTRAVDRLVAEEPER